MEAAQGAQHPILQLGDGLGEQTHRASGPDGKLHNRPGRLQVGQEPGHLARGDARLAHDRQLGRPGETPPGQGGAQTGDGIVFRQFAQPVDPGQVSPSQPPTGRLEHAAARIREWQPDALVVGVPFHPDGAAHANTAMARKFARRLRGRHPLPVFEVDERYSTTEAHARGAKDPDAEAACIILEQFLRSLP